VTVLEAVLLGVVQGLTEFLPVSSSGHLVIVPELLGIESPSLAFDVLLHLATAVAVIGYFARELFRIAVSFVRPSRLPFDEVKPARRLGLWIVIGTLPAVVGGLAAQDFVESLFRSTLAVGFFLLVTAALLFGADYVAEHAIDGRTVGRLKATDAFIVGCFQALALAPGISRSGATISGGTFLGLTRESAARFILGAGVLNLGDLFEGFGETRGPYILGAAAALVSGILAVHFMLRFLRHHRLRVFAIYAAVVGLLVIALSLA
jgi:undecaprenyl-diphosphatase